jgi:hypothetical protein
VLVQPADIELVAPLDSAAAEIVGQRRLHFARGRTDRVLEQLGAEARRRRLDLGRAVGGHRAVEPDHGVQVHQPAALVFGDPDVGHTHLLAQPLLRHPGQPREDARQVDRRAAPQLPERVIPDDGAGVIEAVRA